MFAGAEWRLVGQAEIIRLRALVDRTRPSSGTPFHLSHQIVGSHWLKKGERVRLTNF